MDTKNRESDVPFNADGEDANGKARYAIGIVGYGNFGKALAYRCLARGIEFCIGTRNPKAKETDYCLNQFFSVGEAISVSSIVILAIPSYAYDGFCSEFRSLLQGKVIIDVSNATALADQCNAEKLADLLQEAFVVKAFNTLSSWSIQNDIHGASRTISICGNNIKACKMVSQIAQDLGLNPVEAGRLSAARQLEKKALQLFPDWRLALWITVILLFLTMAYFYLRYFIYVPVSKLSSYAIMPIANGVTGCMVLLLLVAVFLPVSIAKMVQLTRSSMHTILPKWLICWLNARKQIGLFALLFASFHACLSLMLLSGEYYGGMSQVQPIIGTKLRLYHRFLWNAELSLLFASLSMTILSTQGITSLPTVSQSMSWREWDFVHSQLGFFGLCCGLAHVVFYAYKVMLLKSIKRWKFGVPHQLFLLIILVILVISLKLFLSIADICRHIKNRRANLKSHESYRL